MEFLREYIEKYGIKVVKNDMNEIVQSKITDTGAQILFPNFWKASIVFNKPKNGGFIVKDQNGKERSFSIAMCDYNGYFDWEILNKYGADHGCIYADTELELIVALETIRRLELFDANRE
jgi:alpha-glucosidase (family GH31 glycosyl hydrolase)